MATTAPNPLAPLTGAQISNIIAGYTKSYPAPLTDAQIAAQANHALSPVVSALTAQSQKTEQSGAGAISGYAKQLATDESGYAGNAASIYGDAEQKQAAADAAESSALTGGGTALASALSSRLAGLGAPGAVSGAANAVSGFGVGAGGATLGTGSAQLGNLIGAEGAARDYGAKLPGIADQQGITDLNNLGLASQKTLGDNLATVEGQLPSITQNIRDSSDSRAADLSKLRATLYQYLQSRNDALNLGAAKNTTAETVAATKAGATVQAAQIKAQSAKEAAAAKASQTSFSDRLQFAKTYGYDPVTNQTLPGYTRGPGGNVIKAPPASSATKGQLSDDEAAKLVKEWHDGTAQTASVPQYQTDSSGNIQRDKSDKPIPIKDVNGAQVYKTVHAPGGQMNYGQAYAMLRNFGKTDVQARGLLNTVYARGTQGRSWITNEEQHALTAASVTANVQVVNGHGVLSAKQYQALKASGAKLPPGQLSAEGAYVIAPGY